MPDKFSWRFYRPGDEELINQLYRSVTGRSRTLKQYTWQWLSAPAGIGDIALIHGQDDLGKTKLIGHHGVMPLRFTNRDNDLLFGKVENTMVLSSYRDKILYPRFEKRFKQVYENRYHGLFATMGPESAIRVRHATGYKFPVNWVNFKLATSPLAQIQYPWKIFLNQLGNGKNTNGLMNDRFSKEVIEKRMRMSNFLSSVEAEKTSFFDRFWDQARLNHGIAPRRDKADLSWRFWRNPYKEHYTFVVDDSHQKCGYAIVSINPEMSFQAFLEDYAVINPSQANYDELFKSLIVALDKAGVTCLNVLSTTDEVLDGTNAVFKKYQFILLRIWCRLDKVRERPGMPRFITESGISCGLSDRNWFVTGIVLEGRA